MILGLLHKKKPSIKIKDKKLTLNPWSIRAIEWASEEFVSKENPNWKVNLQTLMEQEKPIAYLKIFYNLIDNKEEFEELETFDKFHEWIKDEPIGIYNKMFMAVAKEMLDAQPELKDLKNLDRVKKKMMMIGILIGMLVSFLIYWLPDIIFQLKSFTLSP